VPVRLQVGDVHGCYDALLDLLEKVQYTPRVDNLILVGDLVDKGPKSQEVGVCTNWSACILGDIGQKGGSNKPVSNAHIGGVVQHVRQQSLCQQWVCRKSHMPPPVLRVCSTYCPGCLYLALPAGGCCCEGLV
jgi:hypothetical protein